MPSFRKAGPCGRTQPGKAAVTRERWSKSASILKQFIFAPSAGGRRRFSALLFKTLRLDFNLLQSQISKFLVLDLNAI